MGNELDECCINQSCHGARQSKLGLRHLAWKPDQDVAAMLQDLTS